MFQQAQSLLMRMKGDPKVDLKNHWKLITFFIGGNDFCLDSCYHDQDQWLKKAESDMVKTLRFLRDNFPRTMVNLAMPPNVVSILTSMKGKPRECKVAHQIECPCISSRTQQTNLKNSMKTIQIFKSIIGNFVTRREFQEKPVISEFQRILYNVLKNLILTIFCEPFLFFMEIFSIFIGLYR
jgi:hypothetical protein